MKLLITGALRIADKLIPELEETGHEICFMQMERDPLPCDPEWIEGIIANSLFMHHDISEMKNLQYIQILSAGLDRVPLDYIKEHQITLHNARGVYSAPMAEYALAGVLCLYKKLMEFQKKRTEKIWLKDRGLLELVGKRVLIAGCGSIGGECAKRFGAMGCYVTGVNRHVREDALYDEIRPFEELETELSRADIVVLSLPAVPETTHLMNKERLALLKDGAVLVNIGRGVLVDTGALIDELSIGRINAVIDVYEEEPLCQESPLWDMCNVVLTPHNSWVGDGNDGRMRQLILKNLTAEKA